MLKYIKWICLTTGIIGIIILTSVYQKKFTNLKNDFINDSKTKTSYIYNTTWYRTKTEVYNNNELIKNTTFNDPRYVIFYKNYIEYYNPITNQKKEYKYSDNIKNQKITINYEEKDNDFFLPNGTYNIKFENEYLKLSQSIDNQDYIYYFISAEG